MSESSLRAVCRVFVDSKHRQTLRFVPEDSKNAKNENERMKIVYKFYKLE